MLTVNITHGFTQNDTLHVDTLKSDSGLWKSYGHLLGSKRIGVWNYINQNTAETWKYIYFDSCRVHVLQFNYNKNLILSFDAITKEDGSIAMKEGVSTSFFSNGFPNGVYNYRAGKLDGLCVDYYSFGQIRYIRNYQNGIEEGVYSEFYENGQLKETGFYQHGFKFGKWSEYFITGSIMSSGHFIVIETNEYNCSLYGIKSCSTSYFSLKDGIWEYKDQDGVVQKTEIYKYGRLEE